MRSNSNFYCPGCCNEEVYSLSAIYEMGRSRFETSGFTYDGDIGVFSGSGIKSSLLSQRCAPPEKPRYFLIFVLGIICSLWGELLIKGLLSAILLVVFLILLGINDLTKYFLNLNLHKLYTSIVSVAGDNIDNIAEFVPLKLFLLALIGYWIYRVWYYQN